MHNHYITTDGSDNIIDAFSDTFKAPQGGDILVYSGRKRHFKLKLKVIDDDFEVWRYKYVTSTITEKTQPELDVELDALKDTDPAKIAKIRQIRHEKLEDNKFITVIKTAQDYGHDPANNLATRPKILDDTLMNAWAIWFEDMAYLLQEITLSLFTYDEITSDNTDIFPAMPAWPGDIRA